MGGNLLFNLFVDYFYRIELDIFRRVIFLGDNVEFLCVCGFIDELVVVMLFFLVLELFEVCWEDFFLFVFLILFI